MRKDDRPACVFAQKASICLSILLIVCCAAFIPAPAIAGGLNADEQRMADWIDAHTEDAIALLKEAVDIPSGTLSHAGVREVGKVMARELDDLGFETEWIDLPPEVDRAGHLFGRKDGKGRKILLVGHLDTVFEEEDGVKPFTREAGVARGHGVSDMKSGNTIIIYALKALREIGALDDMAVTVAFMGDEEKYGRPVAISRKDLIDAGIWADIALGFEEGVHFDDTDWTTVARRSSSSWVLTVAGMQSHSSDIFSDRVGAGAIFEAARILNRFYEDVRGEEHLTFNAGTIQGGTEVEYDPADNRGRTFGKTNVVPRKVVVHGGIRAISQEQLDRAREKMQAIVAESLPHTNATIEFGDGYPPMAPTEGNLALARELSAINVALGRKPMPPLDPSRRGAADISFVAPHADSLAGLGAVGGGGHTPDEYLDLSTLPLAIKRAAILMYRAGRNAD